MTLALGGVGGSRATKFTLEYLKSLRRLDMGNLLEVVEDEIYSRCPTRFLSAMVLLLRSKQGLNVRSIQEEKEEEEEEEGEGGGGGGAIWSIPMCCSRPEDLTGQAPAGRQILSLKSAFGDKFS